MAGSYQDFDPDSPKAIAARKARVENFLERHGFLEVNTPRNTRDVHQKVHMEPVYPLDVADQMGDERMVNSLLQLGAKKRSNTKVSIFAALRSLGSRSAKSSSSNSSSGSSKSGDSSPSSRMGSCLKAKAIDFGVDDSSVESEWV